MINSRSEFLSKIDDLILYEDDREVILNLMNNLDEKLFVKILEEIIDGKLFFSDFKTWFSDEKYRGILKRNIETQSKLDTDLTRLIEYREKVMNDTQFVMNNKMGIRGDFVSESELNEIESLKTSLGLTDVNLEYLYENKESLIDDDFTEEDFNRFINLLTKKLRYDYYIQGYENKVKDLVYSMLDDNDSEIVRACKQRLITSLNNGTLLLQNPEDYETFITEDGYTKIRNINTGDIGDYLIYDELVFSVNNYVLPIDHKYITLDDTDLHFMKTNGLNESEMKKMKAVTEFIKLGNLKYKNN